ncbi:hypothetical protein FRC01_008959 [Tulasnella sp. 417]|nr:hypothetical protein FRC01_008959 [Tulasnella sp. 417]
MDKGLVVAFHDLCVTFFLFLPSKDASRMQNGAKSPTSVVTPGRHDVVVAAFNGLDSTRFQPSLL